MKSYGLLTSVLLISLLLPVHFIFAEDGRQQIPAKNRVTLVDLGANKCIPCKMMAPILEEVKEEYAGRAEVLFVDVWQDPDAGKRFGIKVIPTQIFYDRHGKEVSRHVGFMDKQTIVANLDKLLAEK